MSVLHRAPGRVLVVEDDKADQFIALRVIRRTWPGVRVEHARDGQEALELLGRAGPGALPELILLDINMPRMDGHEFLERFCGGPDVEALPAIVMLTSSDHVSDRTRSGGHRCVRDYLIKPLTTSHLSRLCAGPGGN